MRTALALGLTRMSHRRRLALSGRGRVPWLQSGTAVVAGGPARGIRLDAAHLPPEHIHAHHILRGTLEVPGQEALRRKLAPGATLFDVGANVGFFTLFGARLVGPAGRVVAFEPVPANAAAIRAHARANGFSWVEVREQAVGERSGRAALSVPRDASWAFLGHRDPGREVAQRLEVETVALDELRDLPEPDVVKVDTEGAEAEVLRGMRALAARRRPVILAEMHANNAEFAELAESLAYRVENLEGTEPVPEAHDNVHVLATPRR